MPSSNLYVHAGVRSQQHQTQRNVSLRTNALIVEVRTHTMVYPFQSRCTMSDTLGLFEPAAVLETIPMIDADMKFMHGFYRQPLSGQYMNILLREIA